VGTYNVVVTDTDGLSASASFVVTATSTLTVNPSTAPVGVSGVALTVSNFGAGATVNFYIANTSSTIPLLVTPGVGFTTPLVTNASGIATATFTVPQLALGSYTIIANETSGAWNATAAFNVGAATLNVVTGATTYAQGSVVSWTIQSTFATSFQIMVADPVGTPAVVNVAAANFVPVGALQVYPVGLASLALPSDAATGTWAWNASVVVGTTIVPKSGTFTVVAGAAATNVTNADLNSTLTAINDKLNTLNATLVAINGNVATLSTNVGYILTNVTALRANITSISNGIATLTTTVGSFNTSLASISATLTSVSGTVGAISSQTSGIAGISSTVGTMQTSLSDINAKVSSIQTAVGGIATIQTDLGTLSGTVSTINNGVATIQTDIGTLKTDVSDLQTSVDAVPGQVNVPIYIVLVIALIAAIAAVASLLLVRRKIAG
jgi:peptidoglycan hydrolase CwlO-like protein